MSYTPPPSSEERLALAAGRFPTWLRTIRKAKALSQDQLAAAINANGGNVINGSVICHWETGRRRPNGLNLLAMCYVLEVSLADAQHAIAAPEEEVLTVDRQPG
jgi:transcriptional regulator with XRE-family HTH domain